MKKIIVFLPAISIFLMLISACQPQSTDSDAAKIQESIEKIKTQIHDSLTTEKLPTDKASQEK